MDDRADRELHWGSDAGSDPGPDLIEQGRERSGPGRLDRYRFQWRPRGPRVVLAVVLAALAAGLLGGYLAGDAHGHQQVRAGGPTPSPVASPPDSIGLAGTGSQCSTVLGHTLQIGIEVVNGSPAGMQLGQVTARFPQGGLKLTQASWGPCGTLPYAHRAENSVLGAGSSTWLSVTVTTLERCPQGLPVYYVASYSQQGHSYTVVLPGFADLDQVVAVGCPTA
ncbi:MAG TPA: hypothetical protein VHW06_11265 [Streptosporangiaceae bacterium]|nr:hypothetical protein [Streptosporangiaceae bacterium]